MSHSGEKSIFRIKSKTHIYVLAVHEEYKKCLSVLATQYTYSESKYDVTLDVNISTVFL